MALASIGSSLSVLRSSGLAASKESDLFEATLKTAKKAVNNTANPLVSFSKKPIAGDPVGPGTAIPEANTDPAAVSAWWAALSSETREQLIETNYAQLGTLRGLPAQDMDQINRKRLGEDKINLEQDLKNLNFAIASMERSTSNGRASDEMYRKRDKLETSLENVRKIKEQMDILDEDSTGPEAFLLTYSYQNDGRFAVALGNPDTADNTAVLVPGAGHDVRHEGGPFPTVGEGRRLYDEMSSGVPVGLGARDSRSVIVWLGADMPDAPVPSGMNGTYGDSEHGARWLYDDVKGYQAASTNPDGHMTIVAHSYGSYMAGEAVQMGLKIDDLVVFGSPGIGGSRDTNAAELGMSGHVWAAEPADGDGIPGLDIHGMPPTDARFGATVFSTDGSETHGASEGHGGYLTENSESLDNIAKIATGNDDQVSRTG